ARARARGARRPHLGIDRSVRDRPRARHAARHAGAAPGCAHRPPDDRGPRGQPVDRWLHGAHAVPRARHGGVERRGPSALAHARPGDGPPVAAGSPPAPWPGWHGWLTAVFEDRAGTLWVASGEELCHAPAAAVAGGGRVTWQCETIPDCETISALYETPGGTL